MDKKIKTRINKYLADKGFSTRRGADKLITAGLIKINGKIAKLGETVTNKDKVEVGKNFHTPKYIYLVYNKPKGVSTDKQDKMESIMQIKKFPKGVYPVGRLDKDSSGLIILTNDGRIVDRMLNPKNEHEKEYEVKVDEVLTEDFLKAMERGVKIKNKDETTSITKKCKIEKINGNNFRIIISEGKNRQIRRMCQTLNYHVRDLKRVRIMNINLGKLKPNEFQEIRPSDLNVFLKKLGL